jgi:hypothetical protein
MSNTKKTIAMVGAIFALFLTLQGSVHADYGFAPSEKSGYGFSQSEKGDYGFVKASEPSSATTTMAAPWSGASGVAPLSGASTATPYYQYPYYFGQRDPGSYCHCPLHNNQPYRYYGHCPNNQFVNNYGCKNYNNYNGSPVKPQRPSTVIGVNGLIPNR